jgi:hypothetical protein
LTNPKILVSAVVRVSLHLLFLSIYLSLIIPLDINDKLFLLFFTLSLFLSSSSFVDELEQLVSSLQQDPILVAPPPAPLPRPTPPPPVVTSTTATPRSIPKPPQADSPAGIIPTLSRRQT